MNLVDSVLGLLGAGALLGIIFIHQAYLTWRVKQIEAMERHRAMFFRSAGALVKNKSTPDEIIKHIEFLMENIDSPVIGRIIFLSSLWGGMIGDFVRPSVKTLALESSIQSMTSEMQFHFYVLASRGMFAATFTNALIGPFIRRFVLYWVAGDNSPKPVNIIISRIEQHYRESPKGWIYFNNNHKAA